MAKNALSIAAGRRTGLRTDPYSAYNFHLEVDGLIVGGFSSISGLEITTAVDKVVAGGKSNGTTNLIKNTTYSDLVLKKGLSDTDMLFTWYRYIQEGLAVKRNITLFLLDHKGTPTTWWDLYNAMPIKWVGPSLEAMGGQSAIATESITITYERFNRSPITQGFSIENSIASALSNIF